MKPWFYRQWFIVTLSIAVFAVMLTFVLLADSLERERAQQQLHILVLSQAGAVRARLEREINSTFYLTRGLIAYVSIHPHITQHEFNQVAAEIVQEGEHVRDIGLAPNNVIRFVYPLKGNEAALGLRYMDHPEQRATVLRMMRSGRTVVAGPIELVQGGRAFINRTPIYVSDPHAPQQKRYWGLASVAIDVTTLFREAGLARTSGGVRYALRGKDGLGADGAVFFGDPALFKSDAITMPVTLPAGAWQLAALPVGGWNRDRVHFSLYFLVGFIVSAILAAMLYLLLRERNQIHHLALHDNLTGLPNRLYFNLRLDHVLARANRQHAGFALLYLDLDDFKPINDQSGHKTGDMALAEVGRRLQGALRRSDTVARVGGDEFMAIMEDLTDPAEACALARKLIDAVRAPMRIAEHDILLGASIGFSFFPRSGGDADQLVRGADQAMYHAKTRGKNRCACDQGETIIDCPP